MTVAKACQVVCRREARHTEANMAALSDRDPGTLKMQNTTLAM